MDCKRLNRYCALRQLFSIVCIMAMMSCTWVKDERDDCPEGFWLKLNYTYNLLDIEAAQKYVTDASVYIFDADGKFAKSMYVNHTQLINNGYRIRVEDLPEGDYQFVVWSGIDDEFYRVTDEGNIIDNFRLSLIPTGLHNNFAGELPDLFHGYLAKIHYDNSYAVHQVNLTKDTNILSCLVVSVNNEAVMNSNDYSMVIQCDNATMDAYNNLVETVNVTYEPNQSGSVTFNDDNYGLVKGIQFRIPTLRLITDKDNRIALSKKADGVKLFDISLSEYIGTMGTLYTINNTYSVQEYLDRQDFFTVVFYLSDDLERLIDLKVDTWRMRTNNHLNI